MTLDDIDPESFAKELIDDQHYIAGETGNWVICHRHGKVDARTRKAALEWRKTLADGEFERFLALEVQECISILKQAVETAGYLRLTRVIAADRDWFIQDVVDGKNVFGDCWSRNWGGEDFRPTAGAYSRQKLGHEEYFYIIADVPENHIDWKFTISLMIGWGDFEREVRTFPHSSVNVVRIENREGDVYFSAEKPLDTVVCSPGLAP